METLTKMISIVAFLLICIAHLIFIAKTLRGQIRPNAISWGAWAFAGTINVLSYLKMSGDPVVTLWTVALAGMSGVMFIASVFKRGSYRFTASELSLLTLSIVATLVLYVFHNARGASLIMVMALAIPFIPTILGLIKTPENESAFSWIVLNSGYALVLLNVFLRWKGEWGNIAVPLLCLTGNSLIIWLSSDTRKRRLKKRKGDN